MENYQQDTYFQFNIGILNFTVLRLSSVPFSRPIPQHQHSKNGYEIHYVMEGKGCLVIDSKQEIIFPNDLIVTGPGIMHEIIPGDEGLREFCFYVVVKSEDILTMSAENQEIKDLWISHTVWKTNIKEPFSTYLKQLNQELQTFQIGQHDAITMIFKQFILALIRLYADRDRNEKPSYTVPDAFRKTRIENEFLFHSDRITLGSLADLLQLSERQVERYLKEEFHASFSEMKQHAKINHAIHLLKTTKLSITEIAEITNFCSVSYFCKIIKNITGKTAKQIRDHESIDLFNSEE